MREFGVCAPGMPVVEQPGAYGLALDHEGRLAVIDTPEGFCLPGGGIEGAETPEATLRREVLEATGRTLSLQGKICEAVLYGTTDRNGACVHKIGFFYQIILGEVWQPPTGKGCRLLWLPRIEARSCLSQHHQAWAVSQVAKG